LFHAKARRGIEFQKFLFAREKILIGMDRKTETGPNQGARETIAAWQHPMRSRQSATLQNIEDLKRQVLYQKKKAEAGRDMEENKFEHPLRLRQ
jgi:hypothetical protein